MEPAVGERDATGIVVAVAQIEVGARIAGARGSVRVDLLGAQVDDMEPAVGERDATGVEVATDQIEIGARIAGTPSAIRFCEPHMQRVTARVLVAVTIHANEMVAGGNASFDPEVPDRTAIVIVADDRAVGSFQLPFRVDTAGGVDLQRARGAHRNAEIIDVAGRQHASGGRSHRNGRGRGAGVAVIVGRVAASVSAVPAAGRHPQDRSRYHFPIADEAPARALTRVAVTAGFEIIQVGVFEFGRIVRCVGAERAARPPVRLPYAGRESRNGLAGAVDGEPAAARVPHGDPEVPPVGAAGSVAHAIGHRMLARLRGRAGELPRCRVEAQPRHVRLNAVGQIPFAAGGLRQGLRADRRAGRVHARVRTRSEIERQGAGAGCRPLAPRPKFAEVGVHRPVGVPAGVRGGEVQVPLGLFAEQRHARGAAAGAHIFVGAFVADDLHAADDGRFANPPVFERAQFEAVAGPVPDRDGAAAETRLERGRVLRHPAVDGGGGQVAPIARGAHAHVGDPDSLLRRD